MNIFVETWKVQEHWTNELPKMEVIYHDPKVKVAERGTTHHYKPTIFKTYVPASDPFSFTT